MPGMQHALCKMVLSIKRWLTFWNYSNDNQSINQVNKNIIELLYNFYIAFKYSRVCKRICVDVFVCVARARHGCVCGICRIVLLRRKRNTLCVSPL